MARNHQSSFWNQDAVVATGLAFAAMASLQSKLFPAVARLNQPLLTRMLDSKVVEWWPVLLIISGVALWLKATLDRKSNKKLRRDALVGGSR